MRLALASSTGGLSRNRLFQFLVSTVVIVDGVLYSPMVVTAVSGASAATVCAACLLREFLSVISVGSEKVILKQLLLLLQLDS